MTSIRTRVFNINLRGYGYPWNALASMEDVETEDCAVDGEEDERQSADLVHCKKLM